MSLATRCPACATVFRVVRDQLKVSEGWVRCGRCSEVFNAAERLFELEAGTGRSTGTVSPAAVPGAVEPPSARSPAAHVGAGLAPPSTAPSVSEPAAARSVDAGAAAYPVSAIGLPAGPGGQDGADTTNGTDAAAAEADLDLRADPATMQTLPTPGFVLRAERAERRRHPARRGAMALLAVLLAATLAGQMALHDRDDVAAGWPAARPWLQIACEWLGCRVEPPRHIDSLAVDSSGLVRVEGSALYRLSLVVQNRSPTPVRMPAVDLALTDAQGRTTVRRVMSAADLGSRADSLPGRGEVSLNAMLELGEIQVAGYTVELFYP
jgi:predicted Zn finger-like uncharacterized protein